MINIDLKNLNNEYDVGFIGEHNAEKLHIDISSLMSSDISFFVCVFCNGYAETYNSERYYVKDISDNSIDTVLSQSLTKTEKCKMIVGAYGEDENGKINLLKKSDIVNLHFLDSLDDTNAVYKPEVEGLYKELVDLENKFNNGLDLLESKLESIATATTNANTAATAASAVANDIKQKSENGYFNGEKGDKGDPGIPGEDGTPGTTVYSELSDKPSINNVTLVGNKTLSELGINIPTKLTDLENDGTFIENDDYASYSHAGIVKFSVGGGITVDDKGVATVAFPLKEVTSKTDDIRVTHGSGIYTLEFNSGKYAKLQSLYAKQDKLTAGDNITIVNNTISASCVIKPLALSTNANAPTLLTDIGAGAFITTNTGYVATSGGFKKVVGKGAELIVVLTKKDGVSQLCVTVQTGSSILYFWDEMTASDTNEIFLSTLSVKKDLDALTDRNVMSGLLSKTMLEERIKKSEIGDGLKYENGKLSLDIPVATDDTGYGG